MTAQLTPAPQEERPWVGQTELAGDAGGDAGATPEYTTAVPPGLPQTICSRCRFCGPHRHAPGSGPHWRRLICGNCGTFLKWVARPRALRTAYPSRPSLPWELGHFSYLAREKMS